MTFKPELGNLLMDWETIEHSPFYNWSEEKLGSFLVGAFLKKRARLLQSLVFLFSAHISYGKGKYLNQTGFFYKICQELLLFT